MALDWPVKDVSQPGSLQHDLSANKRLQIVYVSIVSIVMLAALLEWVLWLLAFLYCLLKAWHKSENASTKILVLLMVIVFTLLR